MLNMPALSPTMTQGNIGVWKKSIGDPVAPGDVLVEIETDKAQMEMECQEEGYLAKIFMPEGTREAPVGQPMAILVDKKEDVEKFKDFKVESTSDEKIAPVIETVSIPTDPQSRSTFTSPTPSVMTTTPPPEGGEGKRVAASPLAKGTARNMGVNLVDVVGSGPNGRILKDDVIKASQSMVKSPSSTVSSTVAGTSFIDIPLTSMRKVIAERLSESKQTIPHYYLTIDVQMDNLMEIRERFNQSAQGKYKLSVNDFIIKAAARAMADVPKVNSSWHGTFIRQFEHSDISIAVATEAGLITPIITCADLKGLITISNEMRDLVSKARESKLRPEQFQGGTFTISNLGMFGIKHFTAIINPPQSCILAVGGTERRFIPNEAGSPIPALIMTATMSCDHRVVDGATGAQWLQYFKKYMEDPLTILL